MEATAARTGGRVRTVLAWAAVAVLPVVVVFAPTVVGTGAGLTVGGVVVSLRYLLPILVVTLPLGLLGRRPMLALTLMLVGSSLVTGTVHSWEDGYLADIWYLQFLVVDLVVGVIAAHRPRRVSVPAAGLTLAVQIGASFLSLAHDPVGRAELSVLAVTTAWVVGDSVRSRRRHAAELRDRAAAAAVTAERLRIARELHDMVAHSLGVIAIQAGAGARVIETQPAQARAALAAVETASRDALAGLRRTLGALRRPEGGPAPLDPTPGLADLDRLARSAADAGVRLEVRRIGAHLPVPADVDLAAFRIVQEAVTNVVRHAGVDSCRVSVEQRSDELTVEVVDDGHGGPVGGEGHGLIGMRERVDLLGGRFRAGPRPQGGFRVAVRLPLPDAAAPGNAVDGEGPAGDAVAGRTVAVTE
ncbi:sensor histidine kinase [Micromonospora sp. NPDC000089]|uniref:sensor histidine kinase n=1 Tax=unclassified Micromonospora TaxID=2617518 RepID=UPI0036B90B81